ncbi:MAG: T9SS type A sorting domain-containing protein [Bacteroidota bacterium]
MNTGAYTWRQAVAGDSKGNVYTVGYFKHTLDFDPSQDTLLLSPGFEDVYLQKVDPVGQLVWAKQLGSWTRDRGMRIFVDEADDIYIGGYFGGAVDFDLDTGVFVLGARGGRDAFVAKYSPNAELYWASQVGGSGSEAFHGFAVAPGGQVFVSGAFPGTATFVPGDSTTTLVSEGSSDVFLAKLDSVGGFLWVKGFFGPEQGRMGDVAVDGDGKPVLVFSFRQKIDADPGPDSLIFLGSGQRDDVVIVKLDADGNLEWATKEGDHDTQTAHSVSVDKWGNVIHSGEDLDNQEYRGYVSKLDAQGTPLWRYLFPGDMPTHSTVDRYGHVYLTNTWYGGWDMDPGPDTFFTPSSPYQTMYVVQLTPGGAFSWGERLETGVSIPLDISIGQFGKLLSTGQYTSWNDFAPGQDTFALEMEDGLTFALYTAQYDICGDSIEHQGTIAMYGCDSIISPSGLQVWTSSGLYLDTLDLCGTTTNVEAQLGQSNSSTIDTTVYCEPYLFLNGGALTETGTYTQYLTNQTGCDSVLTIHLSLEDSLDASIQQNGSILSATPTAMSYQWVNCSQNWQAIPGEAEQEFEPNQSGTYAAILEQGDCRDTTDCYAFVLASIPFPPPPTWMIFPNPTSDQLHLRFPDFQGGSTYDLVWTDALGRACKFARLATAEQTFSVSELVSGWYILELREEGRTLGRKKVVVE